jgi:hypothetical protein
MIDITMTACNRPEILEKTLSSFFRNFIGLVEQDLRLIINIDPVGIDSPAHACIEICRKYFNNLTINMPEKPSFPKAFQWVWQQVEAPLVLHLEDDWEMVQETSLKDMLDLLEKYEALLILRIAAFKSTIDTMKNWNKFYPWNGKFFECPLNEVGGLGFCGHPSLIKKKFISYVAPRLDPNRNPEKQIKGKNGEIGKFLLKYQYGVYAQQNSPAAIRDIGRRWMIDNGFKKAGSKSFFTEWENAGIS